LENYSTICKFSTLVFGYIIDAYLVRFNQPNNPFPFPSRDYLKLTGLLSVLFGLPPVALKAYRTLRRGHFDANCMMVFAALGATMLGEYEEAASVSFLFAISEFLETRAASQAKEALDSIVHLRPDHANLITDLKNTNKVAIVPTSCLPIGSVVSVRMGDKIPADGIVLEGQVRINNRE
jgi:Cd2+/Zn2+-exporting ATPase